MFNKPGWRLGVGDSIGDGAQALYRGNRGQNSVDHIHYFIANEDRDDHLPVACVPRVDGIIGSPR